MWDRASLKAKAKEAFKANYWKCVLVAFILSIALGGAGGSSSGSSSSSMDSLKENLQEITANQPAVSITPDGAGINLPENGDFGDFGDISKYRDDSRAEMEEALRGLKEAFDRADLDTTVLAAIIGIVLLAVLAAIVVSCLLTAFLFNPLQIGCRRFFLKNISEDATLKELGAGFESNYLNKVKVMFLVDLSCFLWGLLFVIPGIIKKYEYRMVVYLISEDPTLTSAEAKAKSREMMDGQKWAAFVLDLSFIGWALLGILTCGILYPFFLNPYIAQTHAVLFDELNGRNVNRVEQNYYSAPIE